MHDSLFHHLLHGNDLTGNLIVILLLMKTGMLVYLLSIPMERISGNWSKVLDYGHARLFHRMAQRSLSTLDRIYMRTMKFTR